MRLSVADKARARAVADRFLRRSRGKLTKREANELGKRYGVDLHWRFLGTSGDKLALRRPDFMVHLWSTLSFNGWPLFSDAFKNERRAPLRYSWLPFGGGEVARHMAYYFAWLGPQSGRWPGDRMAFDPTVENAVGHSGTWRVACALDCPCGKCWRPSEA